MERGSQPQNGTQHHAHLLHASRNAILTNSKLTWRQRGRAIRRAVTLTDNINDLIGEADRRGASGTTGPHTHEQDRLYRNYELLLEQLPELEEWISNPANVGGLDSVVKELSGGADSARADDASSLKTMVVAWLNELDPPVPRLSPYDKAARGFHNDSTARLICPVDYDWDDLAQREKIRDWHPDYLVTANSWPRFLYKDNKYDPANPAEGLFKGAILVRAFKLVFTSPSSADDTQRSNPDNPVPHRRRCGERRTRPPVAQLLKMKKVEPRAIAYIAVQVRFALSHCGSWRLVDSLFDHGQFYSLVVKWFEDIDDPAEKAFVDDLLLWWNREVFGRESVMAYAPQVTEHMSVATSFKRRRIVRDSA